ncbi:MAG: cation transporter [Thermoanaerobaculales bacterium]|nr:cation transporter [Thermoanaerobaculales bacterium]
MRHLRFATTILLAAGLFVALAACDQKADQSRTVFTVEGMHCDACSTSIVTTLEKVEGVDTVSADHETGIAEAIYRPRKVDVDTLKTEIESLGYTVVGMETETVAG